MLPTSAGSTGEAVQLSSKILSSGQAGKKGKSQLYGITWARSDVFNDNTLHLGQHGFKTGSSDWLPQNESSRDSRGNQDYERNQCLRWCWDF